MRALRTVIVVACAGLGAGCMATTPAYYSQRVSEGPMVTYAAAQPAYDEPQPRSARRRIARPAGGGAAVSSTPQTAQPTGSIPTNIGAAAAAAQATAAEKAARRDAAIKRTMYSICRGC